MKYQREIIIVCVVVLAAIVFMMVRNSFRKENMALDPSVRLAAGGIAGPSYGRYKEDKTERYCPACV